MPGSGRSTLVRALSASRRWTPVSLSSLLKVEARERGLAGTPAELAVISRQWRATEGDGALIHRAIADFEENPDPTRRRGLIVYNVARAAEVDVIHELVGRQIWIEAAPIVRASRLGIPDVESVRVVPEELAGVSHRADFFSENNGEDIVRFRRSAARVLEDDNCCAVEFD